MNKRFTKILGFSLAEMMVVMLILTVVLAAATPIITKRAVQQVKTTSTSSESSKGPFYGKCGYGTTTVASTDIVKTVDLVDGDALDVDNLKAGTTLSVRFKTANSAVSPKLGIKSKTYDIYDESGNQVGTVNNPAYFPADAVIEFTFDGTNWYYHKKVVINYVNVNDWYRVYSDGWIEQGGVILAGQDCWTYINLKKQYMNTSYHLFATMRGWDSWNNWCALSGGGPYTTTQAIVGNMIEQNMYIEWETKGY